MAGGNRSSATFFPRCGGRRIIPDKSCADQLLVPARQTSNWDLLHESWQTSNDVRSADGHGVARQIIAQIDNSLGVINASGPGIGSSRPYDGQGVHSPN